MCDFTTKTNTATVTEALADPLFKKCHRTGAVLSNGLYARLFQEHYFTTFTSHTSGVRGEFAAYGGRLVRNNIITVCELE